MAMNTGGKLGLFIWGKLISLLESTNFDFFAHFSLNKACPKGGGGAL